MPKSDVTPVEARVKSWISINCTCLSPGSHFQGERQALHQGVDGVGDPGEVLGEPIDEPHPGPGGRCLQQSVGSGEVVVDGLARDPQRSGYICDADGAAAFVDRLAGRIQDAFDRLFVRRGLGAAPPMGAHG
ncbi:hypothetical protein IWGMT90018_06180 [Mycobacterium kiyosense]|nr:hypothetical protein IWGMT90018_06180 [Mycobacterium kiyosense]